MFRAKFIVISALRTRHIEHIRMIPWETEPALKILESSYKCN